jgi:hypothetical protein
MTPSLKPSEYANEAVRIAADEYGLALDYSVESLAHVDKLLAEFPNRAYEAMEIAYRARAFGCYCGEVLVRHANGSWRAIDGDPLLEKYFDPGLRFVVDMGTSIANPIGKVWKRLKNGPVDSVLAFARDTLLFKDKEPGRS